MEDPFNRSWDQDHESKGLLSYEEQANNDNLWNLNQFWLVSPCSAMWLLSKNPGSLPAGDAKISWCLQKCEKIAISKDDGGAISQTRGRFSFSHTTWSIAQITLHRSGLPVIMFCYIIQLNICVTPSEGVTFSAINQVGSTRHKATGQLALIY